MLGCLLSYVDKHLAPAVGPWEEVTVHFLDCH